MDRPFDSTLRSKAIRLLCERGADDLAYAMLRSRVVLRRLSNGTLVAWVSASWHDVALLRTATRSHMGTAMPGLLDLAFEAAIADWPEVRFVVLPVATAA